MSDNSNNRFQDIMNAARNRDQTLQPPTPASRAQNQPLPQQTPTGQHQQPRTQQAPPQPEQPAKRGRPTNGKRNNPDYEQVGAYIPKELYRQVQIRLLQMEPKGQFSDLVEFLLTRWVQGAYKREDA